jgi:hypothetical protein
MGSIASQFCKPYRAVISSLVSSIALPSNGNVFLEVCRCGAVRIRIELGNPIETTYGEWGFELHYDEVVDKALKARSKE